MTRTAPGPPPVPESLRVQQLPNTHEQWPHMVLPRPSHDERARQAFAKALHQRASELTRFEAGAVYRGRVAPAFQAAHGRQPAVREEARRALAAEPFWQAVTGLRRNAQEMLWAAVIDTVEREGDALRARANAADRGLGSLSLDPALPLPEYLTAVDIHAMPGSYHTEREPDDLTAGAIFDRGTWLYTHGYIGPRAENLGLGLVEYLRAGAPEFRPRRILDMGCAIGSATLPWCAAFPEAEVHAIDLAAPCLRYGYARANALGRAVHFSQQNAERTGFPDGHFDLVVSHILLHETSRSAIARIFAESFRLLAPGGRMLHADLPDIRRIPDLFQQVAVDQDHHDNNEPLWASYYDMDVPAAVAAAGFAPGNLRLAMAPMLIAVPPSSSAPATDQSVRGSFGYGLIEATR
jgi:SAM-dependent methyltransferase